MMVESGRPPAEVDVRRLSAVLEVLANRNRLELLLQLREPRRIRDIVLNPPLPQPGENPERPISRQAVRVHLERLVEAGVVVPRRARGEGPAADEYLLSQQRLFAVAEEMRQLGSLRPTLPAAVEHTLDGGLAGAAQPTAGVRLVLVHGLDEGRAFPLRPEALRGERGWVIGRRPGLAVSLDYDPYASAENSEVTWEQGRYLLHDLRSSRNGTMLNWKRLAKGAAVELASGDVIGVGRSLLLFRRD